MRPADDQLAAFVRHMNSQRLAYNGTHVIVSLINQKGREKRIGSELERVVLQASLEGVKSAFYSIFLAMIIGISQLFL